MLGDKWVSKYLKGGYVLPPGCSWNPSLSSSSKFIHMVQTDIEKEKNTQSDYLIY